jgi:DNA gyrase subunit A
MTENTMDASDDHAGDITDGEQEIEAAEVLDVDVDQEMEQSYIDYAMSVIAGRALPDVRDGLKPVHRRILYSMHEENLSSNKSHRKSSSVVGETMGNFHPHGDKSIYDALVRMAQDFSMRAPLVDGQGNFGSIDGDPAAAMRYTEARMSPLAEEMLEDLEKDTVEFQSNYDGRIQEPTVLPSKVPNLLLNGSDGIAVGMSTKIPSHNLNELADGITHLLKNPDATTEDLMEYIPGPDFSTGGKIVGTDGIKKAYKTGKGKIRIRANYEITQTDSGNDRIVITEIPYQSNKSKIVEKIAEMVKDGQIEGIKDLRDESDQDGIRIVVDIKSNAMGEVVANQLVESVLEVTFGIIFLALVDGQPHILSLKDILQEYIDHRVEVIRRRSEYELEEARDRAHILKGRLKALENIDSVIEIIQGSESRSEAVESLQEGHELTEAQASHIVKMQLGSLTSLEKQDVKTEFEDLQEDIEYLEKLLANTTLIHEEIIEELEELAQEYSMERKTEILTGSEAETVTEIDLIPEEECFIFRSDDGYLKRVSTEEISTQHRNGKGIRGTSLKSGDSLEQVICSTTHDTVYFFTTTGNIYSMPAYNIPEQTRTSRGKPAVTLLDLDDNEEVCAVTTEDPNEDPQDIVFATKNGLIKRTAMSEFDNVYNSGLVAIKLSEDDTLVDVVTADPEDDTVLLNTEHGKIIRFGLDTVRQTGRNTKGVNGIKLAEDNSVVSVSVTNSELGQATVLTITENGYGKQTALDNYREQSRYGKGVYDINTGPRNGHISKSVVVTEPATLLVGTKDGTVLRTLTDEISTVSRNSKGVGIIQLGEDDTVASADVCQAIDSEV